MLMTRKKRRLHRTNRGSVQTLCLIVGLVTLAACAERSDSWSPHDAPKKNRISWAEFHHPVQFAEASAALSPSEKSTLARFLARVGQGEGVIVTLATGSTEKSTVAKQRETSLTRQLRDSGILIPTIQVKRSAPVSSNVVRVTIGRHIIKPPACSDWSKPATGDTNNRQSSNYGCATETNLGAMIADPGVLVRGKDLGPADGEAATIGIGRYRAGTVEKPAAVSTQEQ